MSEQIQSLLNEMEDKFQKSFSQINLEEPLNEGLNPQSARKQEDKFEDHKILIDFDHNDLSDLQRLHINQRSYNQAEQIESHEIQAYQREQAQFEENNSSTEMQDQNEPMNIRQFKNTIQIPQEEAEHSQEQNQSSFTQDQNPFYYKELTMKLEKALQKISSDKSITQLKKSSSFYDRIEQFQAKRKRQIERKKQQLQEKEIHSVKDRPMINSHSRAIVNQISNDPIYIRYDRILEKKKEKEQEYKKIKQERQQQQYEKYKEEFDKYINQVKQKYEGKIIRSPEEYYSEMMAWAKHKEKNLESKTMQMNEKLLQVNTFKPMINSKSERILNKNKQRRVPIYERQPQQKKQVLDPNCTFKPKINKTNFYKKMSYYQSQF